MGTQHFTNAWQMIGGMSAIGAATVGSGSIFVSLMKFRRERSTTDKSGYHHYRHHPFSMQPNTKKLKTNFSGKISRHERHKKFYNFVAVFQTLRNCNIQYNMYKMLKMNGMSKNKVV